MRRPVVRAGLRWVVGGLPVLVALAMIVPSLIVGVLSFSEDAFIKFPPHTWGLRQYATLLTARTWHDPFVRSVGVALVAGSLAVIVGVAATLALHRWNLPGREVVQVVGLGPLLAPGVAYAVALYSLFAWLGLLGSVYAVILAHTTVTVPFVFLITGSAVTKVPRDLELAALSLGATRFRAWRDVTLRFLAPAIGASFIFAFVASFDETVISAFLSGVGFVTLPVAIFNSVRDGIDPVITAIATLLTVTSGGLLTVQTLLQRRR